VLPQALENALAGAAIGVAFGVIVADQLSRSNLFILFGHELSLEFDPGLLVLLFPSTVVISVVGALASTTAAIRETAIHVIKGSDEGTMELAGADETLEE
jgi:ABC-type lipoprotein release transport system permease subunit